MNLIDGENIIAAFTDYNTDKYALLDKTIEAAGFYDMQENRRVESEKLLVEMICHT